MPWERLIVVPIVFIWVGDQSDGLRKLAAARVQRCHSLVQCDRAAGKSREKHDALLHRCGQLAETVHQRVKHLHEGAQWTLAAFAEGNHEGFKRTTEVLEVAFEVVVPGGGLFCGIPGVGDLFCPVVDTFRALLVEHVRGSDGVAAEDGGQRLVALLL